MSARDKLKAYVRLDEGGRIVPGSMVIRTKQPREGRWKEITPGTGKAVYVENMTGYGQKLNGALVEDGTNTVAYDYAQITVLGSADGVDGDALPDGITYTFYSGVGAQLGTGTIAHGATTKLVLPAGATRLRLNPVV